MRAILACVAFAGFSAAAATATQATSPAGSVPAVATTSGDAAFAHAFTCPDPSAPSAERKAALKRFLDRVRDHHGTWTLDQVIAFRVRLLEMHHCEATLKNIRAHDEAATARRVQALTA